MHHTSSVFFAAGFQDDDAVPWAAVMILLHVVFVFVVVITVDYDDGDGMGFVCTGNCEMNFRVKENK